LTDAAEFISEFADRLHHGKEEKHLFPALVERGIPIDGGPVGVMLYEHETGRTLVAALGRAAQAYKNDEAGAADIFVRAARSYIELLSFHIHKEDNILFNMARHVLDDSTRQSLLTAFDGEEAAFAERDKYERLAEALAAEWAS
jgi:hemerythrin-like domain-containing protein